MYCFKWKNVQMLGGGSSKIDPWTSPFLMLCADNLPRSISSHVFLFADDIATKLI